MNALEKRYSTATSLLHGFGIALSIFVLAGSGDSPGAFVIAGILLVALTCAIVLRIRIGADE